MEMLIKAILSTLSVVLAHFVLKNDSVSKILNTFIDKFNTFAYMMFILTLDIVVVSVFDAVFRNILPMSILSAVALCLQFFFVYVMIYPWIYRR